MNSTSGIRLTIKLPIRPHCFQDGVPPLFHFRLALHEDLTHQRLEGLRQSRVRNVAFVLVELAPREKPARRNKRFVAARLPLRILPTPAYPDTSTSSGVPSATTRSKDAKQSIDLALPPISFSGISNRSDASSAPSVNGAMQPWDSHSVRHRRRSSSNPAAGLVTLLSVLGQGASS